MSNSLFSRFINHIFPILKKEPQYMYHVDKFIFFVTFNTVKFGVDFVFYGVSKLNQQKQKKLFQFLMNRL